MVKSPPSGWKCCQYLNLEWIRSHGSGVKRFKVFGKLEISPLSRRKSSGWVLVAEPFFHILCTMFTHTYTLTFFFSFLFSFSLLLCFWERGIEKARQEWNDMTVISRLKEKRKRGREGERERERKCPECGWLDGFPFLLIISRARQAGLGLYLADGKTIQSEGPWIENYRWVLCKFTLSFFFLPSPPALDTT